jgi:hypothetical protein
MRQAASNSFTHDISECATYTSGPVPSGMSQRRIRPVGSIYLFEGRPGLARRLGAACTTPGMGLCQRSCHQPQSSRHPTLSSYRLS